MHVPRMIRNPLILHSGSKLIRYNVSAGLWLLSQISTLTTIPMLTSHPIPDSLLYTQSGVFRRSSPTTTEVRVVLKNVLIGRVTQQ